MNRPGPDCSSRHEFSMKYGWWGFNSGERTTALHYAIQAIRWAPWRSGGWRLLACAVLKPVRRMGSRPFAPAPRSGESRPGADSGTV